MDFCSVSWTEFRVPNLRGGIIVFEIFYMFSICMGCDPFGSSATVACLYFNAELRMNHQLRGCQGFPRGEVSF